MKQGKVSMVVPCYNKELYIDDMLRSVYNQIWDNIELILVNDGSTDGTRQVISDWEPKLRKRGYDVVIIDQKNGGCCAAVYAGLVRMRGDYFCIVDCDDEIMPEYVSRMAGWLEEHDHYEWAACSYKVVVKDNKGYKAAPDWKVSVEQNEPGILENYLTWRITPMSWIYMMRMRYVKKCGLIEAFCTDRHVTYEPCIAIPPAAAEGPMKFFDEPLYIYNKFASDLAGFESFEKLTNYYTEYLYLIERTLRLINIPKSEQLRMAALARLMYHFRMVYYIVDKKVPDSEIHHRTLAENMTKAIDEVFIPQPKISADDIMEIGIQTLYNAVKTKVITRKKALMETARKSGRIIGFGALGKRAQRIIPQLTETELCPTELWDKAGKEHKLNGIDITAPDFDSLTDKDIVLVFPSATDVIEELRTLPVLANAGFVMYYSEIDEYLATFEFPSLTNAEFNPA